MFATIIPTKEYDMTNEELASAASASVGTPNPACAPYLGISLVRKAQEEEMDDDDMARRGVRCRCFRLQRERTPTAWSRWSCPWKWRHDAWVSYIALLMKLVACRSDRLCRSDTMH